MAEIEFSQDNADSLEDGEMLADDGTQEHVDSEDDSESVAEVNLLALSGAFYKHEGEVFDALEENWVRSGFSKHSSSFDCKIKNGIDLNMTTLRKKNFALNAENVVICRAIKHLVVNTVIASSILATVVTSAENLKALNSRLGIIVP